MSLRTTRQYISTLASRSGKARVTRQYVSILSRISPILEASASNSIDFEWAASPGIYLRSASNTLLMSTSARPGAIKVAVSNTLTLDYLEAIIGPVSLDAQSLLELFGTARIPDTYELVNESPVAFVQAIGLFGSRYHVVSNILIPVQVAELSVKIRDVTSELDFDSVATGDDIKHVTSVLVLDQEAIKGLHILPVTSQISLGQTIRLNPITIGPGPRDRVLLSAQQLGLVQGLVQSEKSFHLTNELTLDGILNVSRPWLLTAESIMQWTVDEIQPDGSPLTVFYGLQDSAEVQKNLGHAVTNFVWLSQTVKGVCIKTGAIDLPVDNELVFDADIIEPLYLDADNTLAFTTAADNRHEFPDTIIAIDSEVTYNVNYAPRLASSVLRLDSSFFGVLDGVSLCGYSPFVGSTTDPAAPQNLLKNIPVIDPTRQGVTLFYPWTAPATTINLRGPDLGNRNRLESQRIKRETRGGTLIVWSDPMWPKNERLVLGFSGLTEVEGQSLLDFVYLTLGKEIGLTDWEGNTWRVVTMTPSESLVRNSRENLSINLDFEITHSTIHGRSTSELDYVSAISLDKSRGRIVESPTWLIQAANREATVSHNFEDSLGFTSEAALA